MQLENEITLSKGLYIVSTPIGNLKDITIRAIKILKNCDYIACEDTRVTKKLLSAYDIKSNLISHHEHTSEKKLLSLINNIKLGKSVAVVSDAGTPLISDPGYKLVLLALKENIPVIPIPGPSAITASVVGTGFNMENFFFAGFLPPKKNKRINALKKLINIESLLIFFESPRRLKETLNDIFSVLGNRECVVTRELTKYYETFYRGSLQEIINEKSKINFKGEMTIILNRPQNKNQKIYNIKDEELTKIFTFAKGKISTKYLSELLSLIYKKPKKFFYSKAIKFVK